MSREVLMSFARGHELRQSYTVEYDVSDDGEINIQSCKACVGGIPDKSLWIQVCRTRQDVERYTPDVEIWEAIEEYLNEAKRR